MTQLDEITNKIANKYTTNEQFITIAPQKIRSSLAMNKNTQTNLKNTPYTYNRAETFVTIATKTPCCECECCWCYKRDSIDARCCGICYACCPKKTVEEQCNCCPNDFGKYWDSGYVQTTAGYGKQAVIDEKNGLCCCFCFPVKFGLFFPCFIGSIGNGCINFIRNTNVNYFF
jgi:hypothetical protein